MSAVPDATADAGSDARSVSDATDSSSNWDISSPDAGDEDAARDVGPAGPDPFWLPRSMVCGIGPDTIEYPEFDWAFVKPTRTETSYGPFTIHEFQDGIGTQRAMAVSPATHLTARNSVGGGLWLAEGEDVVIHLGVQSKPEERYWQTARIAVTPLINWEAVPTARYEVWKGDRSEIKRRSSGTGAYETMDSQTELIDLIIPGEAFEAGRASELAIAVRVRSQTTENVNSSYVRFTVYAQGAKRVAHPCIPAANTRPIEEAFPFDEYGRYLVGRHLGLLKPRALEWGDLPGIHDAVPGTAVVHDWFITAHSPERTAAFVPILNGKPIADVEFSQVDNQMSAGFKLAYESSFVAAMPEQVDGPVDLYVAEWLDPFYLTEDPFGEWVIFPEDDHHHPGERVTQWTSIGGTNVLRYELEATP